MAGAMGTPLKVEAVIPITAAHIIHEVKLEVDSQAVPVLSDGEAKSRRRLFESIFKPVSPETAKEASRAEREKESLQDKSLTYGEMHFLAMHELINKIKREHGNLYAGRGVFLDLGSGAGKAAISAGLLHSFARVVGIERLGCLHDFAEESRKGYLAADLSTPGAPDGVPKLEVQFTKGDFVELLAGQEMKEMAEQVAVCLAVATCYTEDQMQALGRFARLMPAGAVIITFTQTLPASLINAEAKGWVLVHSEVKEMMWGASTVFIYKKVPVTEAAGPGDPIPED